MSDRFHFSSRRNFLIGTAVLTVSLRSIAAPAQRKPALWQTQLAALEKKHGGRLGVSALNTADGRRIGYRAQERFPVCSTFKVILVGAILDRSRTNEGLLDQHINYTANDLVSWSPITEKNVIPGMSIAALCVAALQYSDNTAANLLMREIGGPLSVSAYARSIGNTSFRLDRWETELNSAIPGDPRDTATPLSMADSLYALTLGNALPAAQRQQLNDWLLGNTTGAKRIRAGVPAGWRVGDKTGSGDYGTANDLGVLWPQDPQSGSPVVLAVYHTQAEPKAEWNNEIVAAAASLVVGAFYG